MKYTEIKANKYKGKIYQKLQNNNVKTYTKIQRNIHYNKKYQEKLSFKKCIHTYVYAHKLEGAQSSLQLNITT